jgi:divalent metal cation (Fe/Co/Zn/Cd) transporter
MTRATTSQRLLQRGLRLEYATLGWNVVGTLIVLMAAIRAGSAGLAGLGLDSAIEIFASVVVVWQLKGGQRDREASALKLIGAAFIALAVYAAAQSIWTLLVRAHPAPSLIGLVWLGVTCVVMLLLAWGKLTTGRQLGNAVLTTEARVTLVDAALAGAVLVGVGLNAGLDWWWADPLAGMVIVYYALTEGAAAWKHGVATSQTQPSPTGPSSYRPFGSRPASDPTHGRSTTGPETGCVRKRSRVDRS